MARIHQGKTKTELSGAWPQGGRSWEAVGRGWSLVTMERKLLRFRPCSVLLYPLGVTRSNLRDSNLREKSRDLCCWLTVFSSFGSSPCPGSLLWWGEEEIGEKGVLNSVMSPSE